LRFCEREIALSKKSCFETDQNGLSPPKAPLKEKLLFFMNHMTITKYIYYFIYFLLLGQYNWEKIILKNVCFERFAHLLQFIPHYLYKMVICYEGIQLSPSLPN